MKKLFALIIFFTTFNTFLYSQNSGCTDSLAYNYDSLAIIDDGSCFYLGCFLSQIGQDIDGVFYDDYSGHSVSVSNDGSTVAIGGPAHSPTWLWHGDSIGTVRVFQNVSGAWTQIGQDIDGDSPYDRFGYSVSLSGDGSIVAIGAIFDDSIEAGYVRIYENTGGSWTQISQKIYGEDFNDYSGFSVSLSGDGSTVAIGAPYNDGNGGASGHVHIYQNISGAWTQIGQDIYGENPYDRSGFSVSLSSDGSIVAIGAPENDDNYNQSGHVRIYQNISGVWTQIGQDINGQVSYDSFGTSVSLSSDGNIVAIGAPSDLVNISRTGCVRIYENIGGFWSQIGQDIDGESPYDRFGSSVSLSGDGSTVAIGAPQNSGFSINNSLGYVRIYENIGSFWTQISQDVDGENYNDRSGSSVSLSGDGSTVAIGAPLNDDNFPEAGHVRIYDFYYNLNTSSPSSFAITSCDSYEWEGVTYDSTGIYTNVYTGANGCDSVVNLDLTINYSSSSTLAVTACDSYEWVGVTYYYTGSYVNVYTGSNGCDSIINLNLLISGTSNTTTINSCDSYIWNGNLYTSTGIYIDSSGSCLQTLDLTINNSSSLTETVTACDSFDWDGVTYTNSGVYTSLYVGLNGCDSINTLNLTINNAESSSIWQTGNELNAITFSNNSIEVDWYNIQTNFEVTRIWLMEEQSSSFKPTFDCSYFIIYEDDFGCIDTSSIYYYSENAKRIGTIITSPNPTSNIVKAKFDNPKNQNVKLELINSNGIKLDEFFTTYDNLEIDLSKYPSGTYYLYFNSEDALQGCKLEELQKISSKIILNK